MARSRATAKKAGTLFESQAAHYLSEVLGVPVRRLPKSGARDVGDLTGVTLGGVPVAVECKNPGKQSAWSVSGWWTETETEADNLGTPLGVLLISRHGKSVENSLCMVSEQMWEMLDSSEMTEIISIKATGTATWNPESLKPISVPRRGRKDRWVVFLMSDMPRLFDTADQLSTASVTSDQAESLRLGEKVLVRCSDGSQIVLLGLGPQSQQD